MRILFGPANIVSLLASTSKALRQRGVETRGISLWTNKYWVYDEGWYIFREISWKKPFKKLTQAVYKNYKILSLILWADIIHWCWDINGNAFLNVHLWLIRSFKKKVFVEWIGSDIRIPEVVAKQNPYYKKAWEEGVFTYQFESRERSVAIQKLFKSLRAVPLLCPEMSLFLDKDIYPQHKLVYQRIDVKSYAPHFPQLNVQVPVLVHTPSATGAKGTDELKMALDRLKAKGLQFSYVEITNMPKAAATEAVKKADVFLDQFIIGGYGLATCEALALGKPVFCYLMPSVKSMLPESCPIIDSSLDELEPELEKFILDAALRRKVGIESRAYAETYHDADVIAEQLEGIYREALGKA